MKDCIYKIIKDYLKIFPDEEKKLSLFIEYLNEHDDTEVIDWNNFDGHITTSGFLYAFKEKKFLVMYHKDIKMYLYPGGHMDNDDNSTLDAAKREVIEETGLSEFNTLNICNDNELVPFDINIHLTRYNERLNLPSHYHFDFRYLFTIDQISTIKMDLDEHSSYKWISEDELAKEPHYGSVMKKIKKII